jgi:hypothetical protein
MHKPTAFPLGSGQQQQQIKINLEDLEQIECKDCAGKEFDLVWVLRKIPAMLSRTGKESIFPVSYFRCKSCLKVTNIIHTR